MPKQTMTQALSTYRAENEYINTSHAKAFKAGWRASVRNNIQPLSKKGKEYASTIFVRLRVLLPGDLAPALELSFQRKECITICSTVNRVLKEYNDTIQKEREVEKLLRKLLKLHFGEN